MLNMIGNRYIFAIEYSCVKIMIFVVDFFVDLKIIDGGHFEKLYIFLFYSTSECLTLGPKLFYRPLSSN